jgi:hypothetical protein
MKVLERDDFLAIDIFLPVELQLVQTDYTFADSVHIIVFCST